MKNHPNRAVPDRSPVPPVLPFIRMTVREDGTMQVTVDGKPYLPPEFAPDWRRESFAQIVDHLTQHRTLEARIEVTEFDGKVYTEYLTPRTKATPPQPQTTHSVQASQAVQSAEGPRPVQFAGSGFIAGEDVAVAIIVAFTNASHDGISRAVFDPRQFTGTPSNEAILFGSISGTITVGKPS